MAAIAVVVALAVALLASGALDELSLEKTAAAIRGFGAAGFVVFLLAFAFIQPLGVSGHVFVLAAALVWPPAIAFGLSLLGALGSALVNVAFVRWAAFDWVQARIPARVRRYEEWVLARGLWGVIAFRALTFTMHPAQLLMGVLRIPLGRLIVATVIGFAPSVAFDVWLGGEVLKRLLAWLGVG